jgi:hypothetical protein
MNGSLDSRGADNHHAGCSGTATAGESMWKNRARSASLHFDHTVMAELIARRWNQDRCELFRARPRMATEVPV